MVNKKNILITGGAGYIGSQVCKEFKKKGYNPIAYDNLSTGNRKSIKWGPFVKGDIRDKKKLSYVFKKFKPYLVVHLAALSSVGESKLFPKKYIDINFNGSLNLIKTMMKNNVFKLIFSSSSSIFGKPKKYVVNNRTKKKPLSVYGKTKLSFEKKLKFFFKNKNFNSISLRYFNVGGADPELEIGDRNFKGSRLISKLFYSIKNKSKFTINGSDYKTKDGTCIRDFIHVKDIALAHVECVKLFKKKNLFKAFNLGTGKAYSVLEVLKIVEKVTKKKIQYKFGPRRAGDPEGVFIKKIKSPILKINNSTLKKIIVTSWMWFKKSN